MREHKSISIADQIFEQLEHDILSGKYARGEILSELRLSNELGVSRTPVREAIRRLEQEKILEEAGRGVVVVGISREDMMDMYDIRLNLEGVAVRRAAERITDEELKEMKDTVDLQRFYLNREGSDSSEQIRSLDSRFHDLLYRSSGSKAFYDVFGLFTRRSPSTGRPPYGGRDGRPSRCRSTRPYIWPWLPGTQSGPTRRSCTTASWPETVWRKWSCKTWERIWRKRS